MNILEHPLVMKYFASGLGPSMAHAVLKAMQEPIKRGERILIWDRDKVTEDWANTDYVGGGPRLFLRLPDSFQPKKEFPPHTHRGVCECGALVINPEPAPEPHWHSQLGVTCDKCEKPKPSHDPMMTPYGHAGYDHCEKCQKPEPEKCGCERNIQHLYTECLCTCHKPASAVEEKIEQIKKGVSEPQYFFPLEVELRALVKLARGSK